MRGHKDSPELTWSREATADVTYQDGGVEETFAPELIRTDQVAIDEAGAAVHVGETVIHFADDAYITPGEARKLAAALVELAEYADASDDRAGRTALRPLMRIHELRGDLRCTAPV